MGMHDLEDGSGSAKSVGTDSGAGKRSTVTVPASGPGSFGAEGGPKSVGMDSSAGGRGLSGAGSVDGAQPDGGRGPGASGGDQSVPENTTKPGVHADARGRAAVTG